MRNRRTGIETADISDKVLTDALHRLVGYGLLDAQDREPDPLTLAPSHADR